MAKTQYYTVDVMDKDALALIASGSINRLESGYTELQDDNIEQFEDLLEYLLAQGIEVELYLPAWYPLLYDYFEKSDEFSGVLKLETAIRKIGEKYRLNVHGSYNPEKSNLEKSDFADWFHLKPEKALDNFNIILN